MNFEPNKSDGPVSTLLAIKPIMEMKRYFAYHADKEETQFALIRMAAAAGIQLEGLLGLF
jgi:hypothetical protein